MADVANMASQDSLTAILDALAAEVLRTDGLAAVQIVTLDAASSQLRIMGSAGFGHWPDFFDRLMDCQRRGGALRMLDAFNSAEPVLVANRWSIISGDPAWAPLRDYLGERDWDSFASIPLIARGKALGVRAGEEQVGHVVRLVEQRARGPPGELLRPPVGELGGDREGVRSHGGLAQQLHRRPGALDGRLKSHRSHAG